ncbi:MAG TPA: cupin domain-containing protein [Gaiellales bacterium]|nr:cupin domain-containing protein [Gaiellales bacterium]
MSDYTILRGADAPDFTGDAPGEFRGYARPMGATQLGLNLRVLAPHSRHIPPGVAPDSGHMHHTIEEIYLVVEGEATVKVGDDVVTLGPRDAVLIPPGTVRAVRNEGDRDAVFVMCSISVADPHAESEWQEGFWPG